MRMPRVTWGIAQRLSVLLASFSVFAAILAGYYTFDSSRDRLQGRAERALMATTQVLARHMQAGFGTVARDTSFLASVAAQEPDRNRLAEIFRANLDFFARHAEVLFEHRFQQYRELDHFRYRYGKLDQWIEKRGGWIKRFAQFIRRRL